MAAILGNIAFSEHERQQLKAKMKQEHQVISIIKLETVAKFLKDRGLPVLKMAAGFVSPAQDITVIRQVVEELSGFKGKVYFKGEYVILKKIGGQGKILRGTRYKLLNPKIIEMGIGKAGLKSMVHQGARLTMILYVPITVAQALFDDRGFTTALLGRVAVDAVGVALSRFAGIIAANMVSAAVESQILGSTLIAFAGAPATLVVVGVGLVIGGTLLYLDYNDEITNAVIDFLCESQKDFSKNVVEPSKKVFFGDQVDVGHLLMQYFRMR